MEESNEAQDHDREKSAETHADKYAPPVAPFLWTSALGDHEGKELKFSGFEPCYIACIRDLEWRINRTLRSIDTRGDSPDYTPESAEVIAPMLIQYSQLIEALEKIQAKDRDLADPFMNDRKEFLSKLAGVRRIVSRQDDDRVHESLSNNIILLVIGFIYTWDGVDRLKKRFGNLTQTLDRMLVAIAAGASLLIPMIIMTYVMPVKYRLVIVSLATILFAIAMSLTSNSKDSVIGATAAYAAVMVVYVGTATSLPDGS